MTTGRAVSCIQMMTEETMRVKVAALLLTMSAAAAAQSSSGYVFFAPGGATTRGYTEMTFQAGVGTDLVLAKGIALNMEVGALGPHERFSDGAMGVFSPGGAFFFLRDSDRALQPFVNGGYSLMFRNGHENLFYFGGGTNWWFSRHVGLRMEVRDHVSTHYTTVHFWGFRFGAAFR
jgi:hypothetical protein